MEAAFVEAIVALVLAVVGVVLARRAATGPRQLAGVAALAAAMYVLARTHLPADLVSGGGPASIADVQDSASDVPQRWIAILPVLVAIGFLAAAGSRARHGSVRASRATKG